jgi:D-alanyl-D-alanine carboxypeptidase/D-alanyl-D-alanine-endopeptidase (penicillin-binding protein 4)
LIEKSAWGDGYTYTYHVDTLEDLQTTPITFFKNDTRYSWSEATGKSISLSEENLPDHALTINGSSRDSLLKLMMQESDNFIAEQLLLACSMKRLKYMSEDSIIHQMLNGPLADVQSDLKWVDGSGLSRYNQMTPLGLIRVLQKILELKGMDYIKNIFPAGGKSGTIQIGITERTAFHMCMPKPAPYVIIIA